MGCQYSGLSPDEQDSDRKEAGKFLALLDLLTPAPWTSEPPKEEPRLTDDEVLSIVDTCFHAFATDYRVDAKEMAKEILARRRGPLMPGGE